MTNSDSGGELISELLRAISAEYGWADYKAAEHTLATVDPTTLARYVGTYENQEIGQATVIVRDVRIHLQTAPLGPEPVEILPDSATRFFFRNEPISVSFEAGPAKAEDVLVIHAGSDKFPMKRMK